jgi:uncharacterized protein YbgA (DUF1722 family)/uncharacterized protein YbbK (DUF523 family)
MGRVAPVAQSPARETVRVGVSACLIGEEVRFDGGHKRDTFLLETLGHFVEFVPVCPEFELGLGVPRESLRLERHDDDIHLLGIKSRIDHTAAMRVYAMQRVGALAAYDLSGYVLKKNSPSCGMERVRVYQPNGIPSRDGRGLFAAELLRQFPHLPVEEEGRLNDPHLRENFIERVFAYRRMRLLFDQNWTHADLIAFHTAHKLQLMAHSPRVYRELGRLVANGRRRNRDNLRHEYEAAFMTALSKLATPARHVNVLQHISGYFHEFLDVPGRAELAALIEDYRKELVPLIVPITLIRHYVRLFDSDYLKGQVYLEPHPKELMLRNRV